MEPLETRCLLAAYIVTNTGDLNERDSRFGDDFKGSLRYCISQANSDGASSTITLGFAANTYNQIPAGLLGGTITLGSALDALNKNITISVLMQDGSPTNWTVQRVAGSGIPGAPPTPDFDIFTVNSGKECTFYNLVIQNGTDSGIQNSGTLYLYSCAVAGNRSSGSGGGIYNSGSLYLDDTVVMSNTAYASGGGIENSGGSVMCTSSCISYNTATIGDGGGISNDSGGSLYLSGSGNWVTYNHADQARGGGIYNGESATTTMDGGDLRYNNAVRGGGVYSNSYANSVAFTAVNIENNTATYPGNLGSSWGGGFYIGGGSAVFDACLISGNTAGTGNGGVVETGSSYSATGCTFGTSDNVVTI